MNKFGYIALLMLLVSNSTISQENLGIANSNYAPTNSILLNPSSSADSKAFIDFNLVGSSVFARNNYIYFNENLLDLIKAGKTGTNVQEQYNTGNAPYKAYLDKQLHGPSISVSYGKFGLGMCSSLRSVTSVNGMPNHLGNHLVNGFEYSEQLGEEFTTNNLRVGSLSWLEFGGNFSYIVQQKGADMITVGGTLKYLNGLAGAGLNIQEWNYRVLNDSILDSYKFRGNYGISNLNTDDPGTSGILGNGSGLGLDLGFNYKKMLKGSQGYEPHTKGGCVLKDYKYKFGVSILDIGRIKFNNGFYRDFSINDSLTWEDYDSADPENLEEIDQLINTELIGLGADSFDNTFKVLLPTVFSAQFDYNFGYGFYTNATWVHGLARKKKLGVERASSFGITPRYERREIEVAVPITVQDYEQVKLGLALRVYSLIIGTDHLGSFFGGGDLYGTDLYFSLKYTMFRPWYCKDKLKKEGKSKRLSRKRGGGKPCPTW